MIKVCPNCGAETEGKFCPDCGTKLEAPDNEEMPVKRTPEKEEESQNPDEIIVAENSTKTECSTDKEEQKESSEVEVVPDVNEVADTENTKVIDSPEDSDGAKIVEFSENTDAEGSQYAKAEAKKGKKKTGLIVGGVIAAIVLLAIIVISSQPKLESIDAKYNGPTEKGTIVNNNSEITVTGTYDDKSTKEVTGWSVDETTIVPGFNDIDVTYQDKTASISVYSPLMSGSKYIASVDEINDVLYINNSEHVDGFSGFSKDSEVSGKYNYDGTPLDLSVSYTKQSGGENVGVEGDEVPGTVIVTVMLSSADIGNQLDRIISAGAAVYTTVDPAVNFDDAYSQIKQCTSDAVDNAEGAAGTDEKKLDNLNLATGVFLANGKLLMFYSFKSR